MTEEELYNIVLQFKPWASRVAKDLDCEGMDILHDVWLKIRHWSKTNPLESKVHGLIATFMDRHIKDLKRAASTRRNREKRYHDKITAVQWEREMYDPREWDGYKINQNIFNLPRNYRDVILMRDICGLTYEEMGRILSLPIGTISSRLYRARRLLGKALDNDRREEVN